MAACKPHYEPQTEAERQVFLMMQKVQAFCVSLRRKYPDIDQMAIIAALINYGVVISKHLGIQQDIARYLREIADEIAPKH